MIKKLKWAKFANISLQKRIIALFFVCIIVPVFALSMAAYSYSSRIINNKLVEYNLDLLEEIANTIQVRLNTINNMTISLFSSDTIQNNILLLNKSGLNLIRETTAIRGIEKSLINGSAVYTDVIGIGVLTNNHEIKTPTIVRSLALNKEERVLVDQRMGSIIWMTSLNGHWQVCAARLIYDLKRQEPIGYMVVLFNDRSFANLLREKEYFQEGVIYLIDKEKRIIAANENYTFGQLLDIDVDCTGDNMREHLLDGNYTFTGEIPDTDWQLVSIMPSAQFNREIRQLQCWIFTLAPVFALISFLLAVAIARQMLDPLKRLATTMKVAGSGDLQVRWDYPYDNEIGVIGKTFDKMLEQIHQLMNDTLEQQQLTHDARLNALRLQINPHFIYNTLDSIKWMAQMQGSIELVQVIKALSIYMRSTIYGSTTVPLRDEVESINNYLFIQKFRYGDQMKCMIDISEDVRDYHVPRLILQPLLENAILHGTSKKMGIGHIRITGRMEGDRLVIRIQDDGIGMSAERIKKVLSSPVEDTVRDSIGLYNVHRRLQLFYGSENGLRIESTIGRGTTVTLNVPLKESKE